MTDFETWIHDHTGRVYRYWVYKRLFTPAEEQAADELQTEYVQSECMFGIIVECIELPDGDLLLGFSEPRNDMTFVREPLVEYYKLSEIRLQMVPDDQEVPYG